MKRLKSIYWRDCRKLLCPGDCGGEHPQLSALFTHNASIFFGDIVFTVKWFKKKEHSIMMIFFVCEIFCWNIFSLSIWIFLSFIFWYLVFDAFQFSELGSHPWLSVLFRRQYIFSSLSFCCKHFSSLKSLVQPKYIVVSHH